MVKHQVKEELHGVLLFVGAVWVVFILQWLMPISVNHLGVTPRTATGLVGIAFMPFLHANLAHIMSNTIPLFVLLCLLAGSNTRSWLAVIGIVLLGGLLLWLFGRNATHVGASGLVYGLISFLIVSGLLERRIGPLLISIFVLIVYGGTLIMGVIPKVGSNVSWDGHLCGAIAGVAMAVWQERNPDAPRRQSPKRLAA